MVVLINSPVFTKNDRAFNDPKMPLGLAYIASFLKSHNIDVEVLDAEAEEMSITQILLRLQGINPDYIGINCLSINTTSVINLSKKIKALFPETLVIVGGVHITLSGSLILRQCPEIDLAIMGEGEYPFYQIVSGTNYEDIPGLIYRSGGNIIENNIVVRINNLDELPFPALGLFPTDIYFKNRKTINLLASRGCPYSCIFCASPKLWKQRVIFRSAKNVIDEINSHMKRFSITDYHFLDDDFFSWPEQEMGIFFDFAKQKKITWRAIGRIDKLKKLKLFKHLAESGCYKLTFGIESGSKRIQSYLGKRLDISIAPEIIENCSKQDIQTKAFFMYGFPDETHEEMKQTLNFALLLRSKGLSDAIFLPVMPYYGTALYNRIHKLDDLSYDSEVDNVHFCYDWQNSYSERFNNLRKYSYIPIIGPNKTISSNEIREFIKVSYNYFYSDICINLMNR